MKSKTKNTIVLMRVGLFLIATILILLFSLFGNLNWQIAGILILLLVLLIFNLIKLSRLKELSIQQNKLRIIHLFKFKSETYKFQDIFDISKKVVVKENSNGPNYIDFPSLELRIKTNNGKNYKFNSKENLDLEIIYDKLKNINHG